MLALENVQFPGGLDTVRGIGSGIGFGTSATIPVFIAVERGLDVKRSGTSTPRHLWTSSPPPLTPPRSTRSKMFGGAAPSV